MVEVWLAEPPTNAKTATFLKALHRGKRSGAVPLFVYPEMYQVSFLPRLHCDDPTLGVVRAVSLLSCPAERRELHAASVTRQEARGYCAHRIPGKPPPADRHLEGTHL